MKFKKAIVRTGTFQMRDGAKFNITPNRLTHWADVFHEMKSKQVNVPILKDHIFDVDHTIGRVENMSVENNILYAELDFPNERDADYTKNTDVSIASKNQLVTGVGTFQDGIEHVSLTSRPAIPGLGGYSLVCSLGDMTDTNPQSQQPQPAQQNSSVSGTSPYVLQRAMDIVSEMFGIPIPPEAGSNDSAAIVFLATVNNCKKAGMIQEAPAAPPAPPAPQTPPMSPPQEGEPQSPQEGKPSNEPPKEGEDGQQTEEPQQGETPPNAQNPPQDDGAPTDENNPPQEGQTPPEGPPQDGQAPNDEEDPEKKKKKKTPGEDEIVASLNDSRRIIIQNAFAGSGISSSRIQPHLDRFCSCRTQTDFFETLPQFEAFKEGLELSLNGGERRGLTGTMTGPQIRVPENENRDESIFNQRAKQRVKQGF